MLANLTLKAILIPIAFILAIPEMIITAVSGIVIGIPPIGLLYVLIMTAIWMPFSGFIIGVSWLYKKAWILGLPIALIGIPLVIIIDIFLQLMPNPDREDKANKAAICLSFPFSFPSQLTAQT